MRHTNNEWAKAVQLIVILNTITNYNWNASNSQNFRPSSLLGYTETLHIHNNHLYSEDKRSDIIYILKMKGLIKGLISLWHAISFSTKWYTWCSKMLFIVMHPINFTNIVKWSQFLIAHVGTTQTLVLWVYLLR